MLIFRFIKICAHTCILTYLHTHNCSLNIIKICCSAYIFMNVCISGPIQNFNLSNIANRCCGRPFAAAPTLLVRLSAMPLAVSHSNYSYFSYAIFPTKRGSFSRLSANPLCHYSFSAFSLGNSSKINMSVS